MLTRGQPMPYTTAEKKLRIPVTHGICHETEECAVNSEKVRMQISDLTHELSLKPLGRTGMHS